MADNGLVVPGKCVALIGQVKGDLLGLLACLSALAHKLARELQNGKWLFEVALFVLRCMWKGYEEKKSDDGDNEHEFDEGKSLTLRIFQAGFKGAQLP